MNEHELRALVRQIVAERVGGPVPALPPSVAAPPEPRSHASHGLLRMAPSVEEGQPCVIEPHVPCALCGFCQSLGH
jgi:hypothetical protein